MIKWIEDCFVYCLVGNNVDFDFFGCFSDYFVRVLWSRFVNFFDDVCFFIFVKVIFFYSFFCYWNVEDGYLDGREVRFNGKMYR